MDINDDTIKVPENLIVYNLKTSEELKQYIINHFKIYKLDREKYFIENFSKDFSNILDYIIKKGPIEAGVDINFIIEKAKAMINFRIYLSNALVLPFAPDRLRRIYYDFSSFMSISFSCVLDLAYLFNMPFIVDYNNITDDDIFIIFVYYGIMFNDSFCKTILKNIIKDRNHILELKEKDNIEKKVFHYIKDYTNSPILPVLEKITFSGGKELNKMINRLLNTFIKYYSVK